MSEPVTKAELEAALSRLERRLMIGIGGIFVVVAIALLVSSYL